MATEHLFHLSNLLAGSLAFELITGGVGQAASEEVNLDTEGESASCSSKSKESHGGAEKARCGERGCCK